MPEPRGRVSPDRFGRIILSDNTLAAPPLLSALPTLDSLDRPRPTTSVPDGVIDHVKPGQEAVDDRPENGFVRAPRDRDGQRGAKADARLGGGAGDR